jgi:demethoxyubiquinone hydroxylase (CLK1/Coq7/Cat5 family)
MPDRRARPSALTPLGGLFSLATAATSMVLGKEYSNILLYSTEKAIMVNDPQLNLLGRD